MIPVAHAMKDARFAGICYNLVHMCTVLCTGFRLNLVFLEHGLIFANLRTIGLKFIK